MGSRQAKVEVWVRRLERFDRTDQTVAVFCREEGVSQGAFYRWRKRLVASAGARQYGVVAGGAWRGERRGPTSRQGGIAKSRSPAGGAAAVGAETSRNTAWSQAGSTEEVAFGSPFTPVRVVDGSKPVACLTVRLPGGTELAVSDHLPVVEMVLAKLLQAESVQDAADEPARSEGMPAVQGESQAC